MKPGFYALKKHHHSSEQGQSNFLDRIDLYNTIGYEEAALLKQDGGYSNTCAIRMSLALLELNVKLNGRLKIKAGKLKGKMIEPGAKLLADQLVHILGKPQIFTKPETLKKQILLKKGIIFFFKIDGYGGGHIDLIEPATTG